MNLQSKENGSSGVAVAVIIVALASLGAWYLSSWSVNVDSVPVAELSAGATVDMSSEFDQIPDNSAALDSEAQSLGQQIDSL